MPPVVIAVGASVASAAVGAAVVGTALSLGTVLFNAAIAVAGQLVTSRLGAAIVGRRAAPSLGQQARERTEMVRTAVGTRRVVYGEAMTSGPLLFAASTGAAKEYLHLVVPLAAHEVEAIDDIYFNETPATDTRFAGFQRLKKALGAAGQVADADLVAEVPEWTSAHRLRGVAYAYLRLQWSAETWPTGLPNVKAVVRGRKVLDPRDGGVRWSCNPALCVRDYLTADFGLGASAAEIDDASFIAAANICDEMVALTETAVAVTADAPNDALDLAAAAKLERGDKVWIATTGSLPSGLSAGTDYFVIPASPATQRTRVKLASTYANALAGVAIDIGSAGSGTHTLTRKAQVRYVCDGVVDLDLKPIDIMEQLLSACGGVLIYQQGRYRLFAGAATAATATLSERDLRAPLKLRPRPPRRELANAVRGSFVDPAQHWQPTEFAPVTKASYESEDGGRIFRDIELPFTAEATRAQRLAKLHLEKSRQGIVVEFPAKLTALRLAVWDVVQLSLARLGWINKEFRVVEWRLSEDGGVDLVLQEEAAAAYAWSTGDALTGDPAPNTQLPSPYLVAPPTGLALASGTAQLYLRADGTVFSRIKLSWTAPADAFVTSGGRIEIQHKKSADSIWQPSQQVAGADTEAFILDVQDRVAYDVRIRAINGIGVVSAWVTAVGHVMVGKTTPPADVTGFTAAPNGALVVFRWQAVADADVAGYSIRYGPPPATPWSAMTELTQATRGTQVTTAAVPPGAWLFAIKARDLSQNESANHATATLAVGNFNLAVAQPPQHPDWLGTKTEFVKHWAGVLVPESTKAANQHSNAEMFEQFVPYPKALCTYEAAEIDVGFDASFRVYSSMEGAPGRGVVAGSFAPWLEIDYRLEAAAYDGFAPWTIGTIAARRLKAKLVLQPSLGNCFVSAFTPAADTPLRDDERGQNAAVASGGTAFVFAKRFFSAPNVQVTPVGAAALIGVADSITVTGFTARLFNTAGAAAAGNVNWQALGS